MATKRMDALSAIIATLTPAELLMVKGRVETREQAIHLLNADPSPATKVFAIPELAEKILLNLPLKDLFVVQSVDTTIKKTIEGSLLLQRAMLLKHSSSPPSAFNGSTDLHPLLQPILRMAGFDFRLLPAFDATAGKINIDLIDRGMADTGGKSLAEFARWDASWRKMRVAAPNALVRITYVQSRDSRYGYTEEKVFELEDALEPTMGDLFDLSCVVYGGYIERAKRLVRAFRRSGGV